ncbi:prohead protease/major capsid protein fusion protein [Veillonella caviae]|uniref:prohead protease/major capsid protein fusion protein n=1 Tax=Veillonella caviae TaxID=248316 RepID=UPI002A91C703|nr:prohead protease/major capsid protein fusion protein [Veillonella caviae]MDY6225379.1 Mu-like prophage major head subunit gpT family protein [Veillonella caviae]
MMVNLGDKHKRSAVGSYVRESQLENVNTDDRTVEISFSSEEPYARWFGNEILCHDAECINLERFNNGLGTVLFNHDRDAVVGHIENVWIEDNRGKALIRFDEDEQSDTIFKKVQSGTLRGVSVGYAIKRYEVLDEPDAVSSNGRFTGPDTYVVTDWEPLEVSIVSVPADPTVGVGRSADDTHIHNPFNEEEPKIMGEKEKSTPVATPEVAPAVEAKADTGITQADLQKALEDERKRTSEITAMFRDFGVEGADEAIVTGATVDEARAMVMDQLRARNTGVQITMGAQESDRFRAAAQDAVLLAAGIRVDEPAPGATELRAHSMVELAREALQREGLTSRYSSNLDMVREAINSTSTFPVIMSNLANRSVMQGFNEAETTYEIWAGIGSNRDFREATRVALSEAGDLEMVPEGGQFTAMGFAETSARTKVATYGKMFSLTRQAIINDDLGMFSSVAVKFGNAAKRLVNKMVYAQLTGNVVMQDGVALFDDKHRNVAKTGEALSVKAIAKAVTAMRRQKGIAGIANLNITPKYLVVPPELEMLAYQILNSTADVTGVNSGVVNPYKGRFTIVSDPELTDPDAWYVVADSAQHNTIEATFLNGVQTPRLETRQGFDVDGIEYKVALDFGASVLDFRGLYKNAGK